MLNKPEMSMRRKLKKKSSPVSGRKTTKKKEFLTVEREGFVSGAIRVFAKWVVLDRLRAFAEALTELISNSS